MVNESELMESRYDFLFNLYGQTSINTGKSLFDPKGRVARAALYGLSKDAIEGLLKKSKLFRDHVELAKDTSVITDPIEKARILLFKEFYESLQAIKDAEKPATLRDELEARITESYPDAAEAVFDIRNGKDPKEIFETLKQSKSWNAAAEDYMTRDYVELPSPQQISRWAEFSETIDLINDLKYVN